MPGSLRAQAVEVFAEDHVYRRLWDAADAPADPPPPRGEDASLARTLMAKREAANGRSEIYRNWYSIVGQKADARHDRDLERLKAAGRMRDRYFRDRDARWAAYFDAPDERRRRVPVW